MNFILQISKYIIGIGLIAWLVSTGQIDLNSISEISSKTFIIAMILSFASLFFATYRLRLLLKTQHFKVDFFETYKLNMLGIFYSLFLPGGVSGDILKGFHLLKYRNDNNSKTNIITTLFFDRYLGLYAMFVLASIVSIFTDFQSPKIEYVKYIIFVITVGLTIAPFCIYFIIKVLHDYHLLKRFDYLYGKMIKVKQSIQKFMKFKLLLTSVFFGIIGHVLTILIIWTISVDLNFMIGLYNALIVSPIAFVVNLLPISPGGIGVGEKAFKELFLLYGIEGGATVFFISRFFMYLPGVYGAYVFTQQKFSLKRG
jgi:uncharacterized protein (TIRG00374 family)